MFHMHTAFSLKEGVEMRRFKRAWEVFVAHLIEDDLIVSVGPIAERRSDTGLDTDEERDHQYFVAMSFRNRAQSERAWDRIEPRAQPTDGLHRAVYRLISDPVFSCWEDDVQAPVKDTGPITAS